MPGNLPQQLTSFVGREREIAEVGRALEGARLVSLVGAGGCGKTRLALEVARRQLGRFPDGVWLVELASLADPELVPQAVATTLGIKPDRSDLMAALLDYFRPLNLLLVLDNCEHLAGACASFAATLLRGSQSVRVMATSREALCVGGELVCQVPPLSLPDPQDLPPPELLANYEAVQLFIDRALYSRPGFSVTAENSLSVARLCQRLDGLPLAIELAAARMNVLTVEQIVDHLDERFRLLTSGSREALPRQQTLQALLDWSYNLLSDEERALLRALSVFAGGFTLEALRGVLGVEDRGSAVRGRGSQADPDRPPLSLMPLAPDPYTAIDLLSRLIQKSLVTADEYGSEKRYRMLDTIRQYAWERLEEVPSPESSLVQSSKSVGAVREPPVHSLDQATLDPGPWTLDMSAAKSRHRDWYLRLAEQAQPALLGEDQETWLDRLEVEHDNLRAALDWSVRGDHNAEAALRLCSALWRFWDVRGYITEGHRWLKTCLDVGGNVSPLLRAKALNAAGNLALEQAEYDQALALHNAALVLRREAGDKQGIAQSLNNLGVLARRRGEYDRAAQLYDECLAIFKQLGREDSIAGALDNLGFVEQCRGHYERAEELYAQALELFRKLGDTSGIVISLNNLGDLARLQGDYERALEVYGQAMELARGLGDPLSIVGLLNSLGAMANRRAEYERARELYLESLFKCGKLGHKQGIAECLEGLATAEMRTQPKRAAQLFGAAESLRETISAPLPPPDRGPYQENVAGLRARLGERAFRAAWAAGRAMQLDDAVMFATEGVYDPPVYALSAADAFLEEAGEGDPLGLTRRELEVLRLAASGLKAGQIAGKLGLSDRTVNAHLHSVYSKIGVDSRAAATRFAIEHKLL